MITLDYYMVNWQLHASHVIGQNGTQIETSMNYHLYQVNWSIGPCRIVTSPLFILSKVTRLSKLSMSIIYISQKIGWAFSMPPKLATRRVGSGYFLCEVTRNNNIDQSNGANRYPSSRPQIDSPWNVFTTWWDIRNFLVRTTYHPRVWEGEDVITTEEKTGDK